MAQNVPLDDLVYCPSCEREIGWLADAKRVDRCKCGQTKKWIFPEELTSVARVAVREVEYVETFENLDNESWSD